MMFIGFLMLKRYTDVPIFLNAFLKYLFSHSLENDQWLLLQAWDVPWDWKIILYVMMPYLMSILLTGIVESAGLGVMQPHAENVTPHLHGTDEEAIRLFLDELLKTAVKLSVLYVFVSPYQPFPDNVFSYRWHQPFNIQNGWLLWGIGGLVAASSVVFLIKSFISGPDANQIQNEAESLVRLLPFIGVSSISNASLLGILGILAPLCEETIYRGFLMTSLTKWLPVPLSIIVSSIVFTLAHQSPGKSTEILIFGVVLGLVYAQTRNLLAPIIMHACWNLGVIFTLIYFQSQGQDIQKYVL
ncbi:PREDICTED: uncharacterized protein LOC104611555 isoform X2 [Nelumbo nucifera]|uniref:Uncharacterized protein LOC104611555 isoform X2 n=1 Tax=Nelumbo nucifera TaxID=4432 RepID=A0A1U8B7E9_NELNU|nr:PREDICTED: uncharacterized protein LOC104611555 isoform X2 [Nelumbo nucifera]